MATTSITPTYTFATATGSLPLSQLDSNYTQITTFLNDPSNYANYLVATGSANTYAVTFAAGVAPTSYIAGLTLVVKINVSNTSGSTINVNSLGAKSITKAGTTALVTGDLVANSIVILVYDGTRFQLTTTATAPGGSNTQVQFNNSGAFGGSARLIWSTTDSSLTVYDVTIGRGAGGQSSNTAVGSSALISNTTGSNNTAFGRNALYSNVTGNDITAVGTNALFLNTANNNTATGSSALGLNTSGDYNTANGGYTLYNNKVGTYNVAVGYQTLYTNTGSSNTAIGAQALYSNVGGLNNTAIGYFALYNNTSGTANTAINPINSAGTYAPVFNPTTQSDRFCMGSTGVTNAYIQVAWTVVSDARDKTDFAPVPHGLDFVSKLKPTAYRYKINRETVSGHGPVRYGFKAQDVLALEGDAPVIVDAEDLEKLRFNDQSMIAVLVNALQELKSIVDEQAARIVALENK
jgi:hypothetical protein